MAGGQSDFDGQFVISAASEPVERGWTRQSFGKFNLDMAPGCQCVRVFDRSGRKIGLLLGTPIDLKRNSIITSDYSIEEALANASQIDSFVEKHIYGLTGTFLFILSAFGLNRIYLDCNGSMSVVYSAEKKTAGATAAVLLDSGEYSARFRKDLYDALDVDNAGWFTVGLTAHRGISRLLCNHYLDLDKWVAVRHWPLAAITSAHDLKQTFRNISDRVTQTINLLADNDITRVALTAGSDSRYLLACSRPLLDKVSFVTVGAPAGEIDVACSKLLARKFNLKHDILPYKEATSAEIALWRLRAGHCVGGNNVKLHPSVRPLEGHFFVGGLGGEIGRGFLWLNAEPDTPLDANNLVARLKLPQIPEVIEKVGEWLKPLERYDTLFKLDLAYIELRMSAWGFCDTYVKPKQKELHPMVSRANYVDMLSIPPDLRRGGKMFPEIIAMLWPELLSQPINRYGDWRDQFAVVKKALRDPNRARRKAVQLFRTVWMPTGKQNMEEKAQ
ncbi:MAG: hypothetical protein QM744_06685 [Mesorhizobium sp.]